MIPYRLVIYEYRENAAVGMHASYADAKKEVDRWLEARGLPEEWRDPRRATIEGPFYRKGF